MSYFTLDLVIEGDRLVIGDDTRGLPLMIVIEGGGVGHHGVIGLPGDDPHHLDEGRQLLAASSIT